MLQTQSIDDACDVQRLDIRPLQALLQSGRVDNCREVLISYLEQVHFTKLRSLMLRLYVGMDVYIEARSFSRNLGISNAQFNARFGSIDDISSKLQTVDSTIEFLSGMIEQCIRWRIESVSDSSHSVIRNAKEFIDENYMDEDLSLSAVAKAVGLSPTYLSALFKREMQQNFSDYLTSVRIEKAKELLCCTSKMIYEIAYEAGFRDYRYFSQIFKKHTGLTPRQFQNNANIST